MIKEEFLNKIESLSFFVRMIVGAHSHTSCESIGSGFLLKKDDDIFLITAAHVMDRHDEMNYPLFLPTANGSVRIKGVAISPEMDNITSRIHDKIDTAVVLLDEDASKKLHDISFVSWNMLDVNNSHDPALGYFGIGFPAKSSNKSIDQKNKRIEPEPYGFSACEADKSTYAKLGVSQENNIALRFEKKKVFSKDGKQRTAPDLNGLSGTPIWGMIRNSATEIKPVVVAVLTEHHQRDIKAILGTRVSWLVSAIKKNSNRLLINQNVLKNHEDDHGRPAPAG